MMVHMTDYEAKSTAESAGRLYEEMCRRFGSEKAWEFLLAFYKGAGKA